MCVCVCLCSYAGVINPKCCFHLKLGRPQCRNGQVHQWSCVSFKACVHYVFSMTPFIRFLLLDCYVIMSCVFNCLVPRPSLHCFTLPCGGSAALVPALWQFIQSELLKQMCMCSPNYNVYVFYIMWTGRFIFLRLADLSGLVHERFKGGTWMDCNGNWLTRLVKVKLCYLWENKLLL